MSAPEGLHWHAYAYTGPSDQTEPGYYATGERGDYWLRRPSSAIRATFERPEDAEAWMRAEAEANPPLLEADRAGDLLYLRQYLHVEQHRTPSLHYVDRHDRLVKRYLVPCPRPLWKPNRSHQPPPCPLRRGSK